LVGGVVAMHRLQHLPDRHRRLLLSFLPLLLSSVDLSEALLGFVCLSYGDRPDTVSEQVIAGGTGLQGHLVADVASVEVDGAVDINRLTSGKGDILRLDVLLNTDFQRQSLPGFDKERLGKAECQYFDYLSVVLGHLV